MRTPWGESDYSATTPVEGVEFYATPSHGGFLVRLKPGARLPAWAFTIGEWEPGVGAWFEEDCAWAAVIYTWPEIGIGDGSLLEGAERDTNRAMALKVLRRWFADKLPHELREEVA